LAGSKSTCRTWRAQGRAEDAGGKVVKPKTAIGNYGHIALVSDTEGNLIGLHSMQ
jgi:predicted enzyme related to lactoylglutathione lyase